MKKCMIAAVAAVVAGGAFAACTPQDDETGNDCQLTWAYTWKFTGKTTAGALDGKPNKNTCAPDDKPTEYAIRVPASLKIQGYTAYCDVSCDEFETLVECQEVFWQTKPSKVSFYGGLNLEVANIIGKKAKQFELQGVAKFTGYVDEPTDADEIKYELTFAGLGKYDKKKTRVSSASGNFAGTLQYPWYVSKDKCISATIWVCDCTEGITIKNLDEDDADDTSVAFGKWSMKFNKKAANKLANNKAKNIYRAAKIPSWVKYRNQNVDKCGN